MSKPNFIDGCAAGDYIEDEIDDFIDEWHDGGSSEPLWEFLGFSRAEYDLWIMDHGCLPFIISARANKLEFTDEIENVRQFALAARSTGRIEASTVIEWLKKSGYVRE